MNEAPSDIVKFYAEEDMKMKKAYDWIDA
jgi:hypothetical protein